MKFLKIIRTYNINLCVMNLEKSEKNGDVLETYGIPKLNKNAMNNLNKSIVYNLIEILLKFSILKIEKSNNKDKNKKRWI